jgi:hypothetical protein
VGQQLPEEIEIHLAKLVADAGRQLTQQHQQQAAQRAAQQAAEDPNLQVQQMAEETKRVEVERKKAKDAADIQIRQDEQARKREKDQTDKVLSAAELAEEKRQADMKAAEAGVSRQDQKEESGRKMSMELLDKLTNQPKGNK